jgi:hypothetical protein
MTHKRLDGYSKHTDEKLTSSSSMFKDYARYEVNFVRDARSLGLNVQWHDDGYINAGCQAVIFLGPPLGVYTPQSKLNTPKQKNLAPPAPQTQI